MRLIRHDVVILDDRGLGLSDMCMLDEWNSLPFTREFYSMRCFTDYKLL